MTSIKDALAGCGKARRDSRLAKPASSAIIADMKRIRGLIHLVLALTVCVTSVLGPFGMMPAGAGPIGGHAAVADHRHHGHMAHANHVHGAAPAVPSLTGSSEMPGHEHGKDCHAACCPHVLVDLRLGPPGLVELTCHRGFGDDRSFASLPQAGPDRPPQSV
ncbi:MAG: hypothetical protein AAF416_17885 [Pseudomonadota bacterium]